VSLQAYNSTTGLPIGKFSIPSFTLAKGPINSEGYFTLNSLGSRSEGLGAFFAAYCMGGDLALVLESHNASQIPRVDAALEGIKIPANLKSPGYPGIELLGNMSILPKNNIISETGTVKMIIELLNPFPTDMRFGDFNLRIKIPESGVEIARAQLLSVPTELVPSLQTIAVILEFLSDETLLDFRNMVPRGFDLEGTFSVSFNGAESIVKVRGMKTITLVGKELR
jgi:hypothetical protein